MKPMQRNSYHSVARRLRRWADLLDQNAGRETPAQKRTLTLTVHNIRAAGRKLIARHHGRPVNWEND